MKEPKKRTGTLSKIREKKGKSGAFKYEGTKAGESYAGPEHTFPMGDLKHARNALARAHFSPNPGRIKTAVYRKYPELKKHNEEREHGKK